MAPPFGVKPQSTSTQRSVEWGKKHYDNYAKNHSLPLLDEKVSPDTLCQNLIKWIREAKPSRGGGVYTGRSLNCLLSSVSRYLVSQFGSSFHLFSRSSSSPFRPLIEATKGKIKDELPKREKSEDDNPINRSSLNIDPGTPEFSLEDVNTAFFLTMDRDLGSVSGWISSFHMISFSGVRILTDDDGEEYLDYSKAFSKLLNRPPVDIQYEDRSPFCPVSLFRIISKNRPLFAPDRLFLRPTKDDKNYTCQARGIHFLRKWKQNLIRSGKLDLFSGEDYTSGEPSSPSTPTSPTTSPSPLSPSLSPPPMRTFRGSSFIISSSVPPNMFTNATFIDCTFKVMPDIPFCPPTTWNFNK